MVVMAMVVAVIVTVQARSLFQCRTIPGSATLKLK